MAIFALITPGLDPARNEAHIVRELFASDPQLYAGLDVRDVSNVAGISVGWIAAPDGSFAPYAPPPPSKDDLKAYASQVRFEVETRGISLGGTMIATDRASQAMISGAYSYVMASQATVVTYKSASGWVTLSAAQLQGIALAVGAHVQACFAKEASVDAAIDAGTVATPGAVEAAFVGIS